MMNMLLIVFSAIMIAIGAVLVICSVISLFKAKEKYGYFGIVFGIVVILMFINIFSAEIDKYHSPHHGEDPTLDDVNAGNAYIDKTKMIHNNDTTYHYEFKWKE